MPIKLIDSPTERTTAATDLLLALAAAGSAGALLALRRHDPWKASLWAAACGSLSAAGALGAVVHGFQMSQQRNELLWKPLNAALGTTIALFVVGVIYDLYGREAARAALPMLLGVAASFSAYTLVRPANFQIFVAYQAAGLLYALSAYGYLWRQGQPGAGLLAAGVLGTIAAAAVQSAGQNTGGFSVRLGWHIDHNGLYHLGQLAALWLIYRGVRMGLRATTAAANE